MIGDSLIYLLWFIVAMFIPSVLAIFNTDEFMSV